MLQQVRVRIALGQLQCELYQKGLQISRREELKKVMGDCSRAETSARWGKFFANRKNAIDESLYGAHETIDQKIKVIDQRGLDGKELIDNARVLFDSVTKLPGNAVA